MTDSAAGTRSKSGYSTWRLIGEELRLDINSGRLNVGDRVATERVLCERFGVNRHTVRQAIAALAEEGLVESRRGSGTFVTGHGVRLHRIGLRTRMSSSFTDLGMSATNRVLDSAIETPPRDIARRLDLIGDRAIRVETIWAAGEQQVSVSTHWFDCDRLPHIVASLRRTGSVTAAFAESGIADYVRASTVVSARHATAAEADQLLLGPGAIVLVTEAVDALPDGTPLQYLVTRFAAARVRLEIERPRDIPPG